MSVLLSDKNAIKMLFSFIKFFVDSSADISSIYFARSFIGFMLEVM